MVSIDLEFRKFQRYVELHVFWIFIFLLSTPPSPVSPHFSPSVIPNDMESALSGKRRKQWVPKATLMKGQTPFLFNRRKADVADVADAPAYTAADMDTGLDAV